MKRGCLWITAFLILLITGMPALFVMFSLLIDPFSLVSLPRTAPGIFMAAILFFSTLSFVLAFSGYALAKKCLKALALMSGILLVSDFFFSLFDLNPFGQAVNFISGLFFFSLVWSGLLRWLEIEEFPYESADQKFFSASLSQDLPDASWFDHMMLSGWHIFFGLVILPLIGISLIDDQLGQQPEWFYKKFILCWSIIILLAWLFIYWKESFERRTGQFHLDVSRTGSEAEFNRTTSWPVPAEWAKPGNTIVIDIPGVLGKMTALIGIACLVVLMTMNRSGIPLWLRNDLITGLVVSAAIRFFVRSQYLIDIAGKTIHQEFTNPLYYRKRRIEFNEVAMVTTVGMLSEWPLLWHSCRLDFSVAIILRDGTVLKIPRIETSKGKYFLHQEEAAVRARQLARLLDCKFQPGFFCVGQSFFSWIGDVRQAIIDNPGSEKFREVLWQSKLSNVSLEAVEPGLIKVDLPTMKEKLVLCLLMLFFMISTHWLLKSEGSFIAENPRLIYLLLLDSTSVLLTLLAAWLWLIDEHYIFDVNRRVVLFRSRLLFWSREKDICRFADISKFEVWKRHSWFFLTVAGKSTKTHFPSQQYFVKMKTLDGKSYQMSDSVSLFDNIPIIRAAALSKIVFTCSEQSASMPVTEADQSKKTLPAPPADDYAAPAKPVVVAPPVVNKTRRRYRRKMRT
ncbi:MAG: hypothetical protein GQF41_4145 [Candidatus Rifleibacterium amylolyticum]|nr:MAG: hypothetical protein GQF41_4145 [Candidatus Rifleibacterium amylolyticum]